MYIYIMNIYTHIRVHLTYMHIYIQMHVCVYIPGQLHNQIDETFSRHILMNLHMSKSSFVKDSYSALLQALKLIRSRVLYTSSGDSSP